MQSQVTFQLAAGLAVWICSDIYTWLRSDPQHSTCIYVHLACLCPNRDTDGLLTSDVNVVSGPHVGVQLMDVSSTPTFR